MGLWIVIVVASYLAAAGTWWKTEFMGCPASNSFFPETSFHGMGGFYSWVLLAPRACCVECALICIVAGAEVVVLCITNSGEVLNYHAFTNSRGIYRVEETMPESGRWDACLARSISSFHDHCKHILDGKSGVKFNYNHPSGHSHTVRPFVYRPASVSTFCI
ncbi:uncharacterized protein [Nicotiana tomentosiformis]|uniref:uncharacterized protein n=1 Tax=Nicotiana tomentosiformis TaxID=4098 RepID=UPI00388CE8E6